MSQHHKQLISRIAITATAISIGLMSVPVAASAASSASAVVAPAAKTAPGQPKFGEQGAHVVAIQKAIMKNGFSLKGGATGVFNKTTLAALKNFQKVVGLKVTGVVDVATAKVLKVSVPSATSTTVPPATTIAPTTTIAVATFALTSTNLPVRGNKGDNVLILQKALASAGLIVKGGIDGSFGSGTTATLQAYQTSKGLPATGLLDPVTASVLGLIAPIATPTTTVPPAAVSAAALPTMTASTLPSRGNRGDNVRSLQNALLAAGIEVKGGADGVFGGATFVAIQKFQAANGLEITGTLTPPTAIKLGLISAPTVQISVFPVQGLCSYENTWHAPRGTNRLHLGVDIIAKEGNLLYAVTDGTITKMYNVGTDKLAGNGVRLTQADGTYFFYGHMQRVADGITIGTQVKAGQVIGYLGKTGGTTTPHLHLEVHPLGGEAIDPTAIVAAVDACRTTTPLAPVA